MRKLSVRELSDLAEIDYPYLTNIEAGTKNPSAENLIKILNALLINVQVCLSTSDHEDDNIVVSQLIRKLLLSFDKIKCVYGITNDFANYKSEDSEQ